MYLIPLNMAYKPETATQYLSNLGKSLTRNFPLLNNLLILLPKPVSDPRNWYAMPWAFEAINVHPSNAMTLTHFQIWILPKVQFVTLSTTTHSSTFIGCFAKSLLPPSQHDQVMAVFANGFIDSSEPIHLS
jgi:hypothetical protein